MAVDGGLAGRALGALSSSVAQLRSSVDGLTSDGLGRMSYASEWTVAQVLSHLGSGAVIMRHNVDDVLTSREPDPSYNPSVWDEWNAKAPADQAADALVADAALMERLEAVTEADRQRFELALGPLRLDFEGAVQLRLNEHALHSWDIVVAFDPTAAVAPASVPFVVDSLDLVARFSARPQGRHAHFEIATSEPDRRFALDLTGDGASIAPSTKGPASTSTAESDLTSPDLTLPAEAFIRLLYGRLDPAHTPSGITSSGDALDVLRSTYRGV